MTFAIVVDLDAETLKQTYPNHSYADAYGDIGNVLASMGFNRRQGSVYFGGDGINVVTCVLAAQKLSREYAWFKAAVRDIRMLRIEEMNDLKPAL